MSGKISHLIPATRPLCRNPYEGAAANSAASCSGGATWSTRNNSRGPAIRVIARHKKIGALTDAYLTGLSTDARGFRGVGRVVGFAPAALLRV